MLKHEIQSERLLVFYSDIFETSSFIPSNIARFERKKTRMRTNPCQASNGKAGNRKSIYNSNVLSYFFIM